jgi:protein-tyrosine sulfotransferase
MFGCMHVTIHGGPKLLDPLHFFLRIRHYSKGNNIVWKKGRKSYEGLEYDRNIPILFIGGMPRSGTTLMRSMMDAHPKMRCGEETRLVPRILGMRSNWYRSEKEKKRLDEAGVGESVINAAVSEFILEIIVKHGKPAERLCNKDPFTLKSTKYLIELFPNARFILMTRDGRATAHSIISRQVTISGFDITSYRDVITKWSRAIQQMYDQCMEVGPKYCIQVKYEDLVLHPRPTLKKILEFADLEWTENVMEHQKHMEHISLSAVEKSTDQVIKPLYTDSLNSWVGHIPADVEDDMAKIAPMLKTLGYDPEAKNPYYGKPDQEVSDKYNAWLKEQGDDVRNAPPEVDIEELKKKRKEEMDKRKAVEPARNDPKK